MSILDGLPSTEAELKGAMEFAAPIVEKMLGGMDLNPRQRSVLELLKEGLSLADILQISKPERDAMFVKACRQIQAGDIAKARDALMTLYQLEPLDARVLYALAVTYQTDGKYDVAGKLYIQFLALDATNAEGYLRLGECFMAAREYDNARESLEIAKSECERGNGNSTAAELATRMLALLAKQRAAAKQH
jgi:tetratricopeptide (TPR) repeat protein